MAVVAELEVAPTKKRKRLPALALPRGVVALAARAVVCEPSEKVTGMVISVSVMSPNTLSSHRATQPCGCRAWRMILVLHVTGSLDNTGGVGLAYALTSRQGVGH